MTWSRFTSLMVSMGERPLLGSEPLPGRYDPTDLLHDRRSAVATRMKNGAAFNEFATQLASAARSAQGRGVRS